MSKVFGHEPGAYDRKTSLSWRKVATALVAVTALSACSGGEKEVKATDLTAQLEPAQYDRLDAAAKQHVLEQATSLRDGLDSNEIDYAINVDGDFSVLDNTEQPTENTENGKDMTVRISDELSVIRQRGLDGLEASVTIRHDEYCVDTAGEVVSSDEGCKSDIYSDQLTTLDFTNSTISPDTTVGSIPEVRAFLNNPNTHLTNVSNKSGISEIGLSVDPESNTVSVKKAEWTSLNDGYKDDIGEGVGAEEVLEQLQYIVNN